MLHEIPLFGGFYLHSGSLTFTYVMFWCRETTCKPCGGSTTSTAECQTQCSPSNFPVLVSTPV